MWRISDDRLIAGDDVPGEADLVAFVAAVRATADDPAPAPTPALAALLEGGPPAAPGRHDGTSTPARTDEVPSLAGRRRLRRVGAAAGIVVAGKIALAGAAAAAGIVGVANLDGAPAVVREPAQSVVHAVGRAWNDITGGASTPVPATPTTPGHTSHDQPGHTTAPCSTDCAAIPAPVQTHGRGASAGAPGHAVSPTGRPTTSPGNGSGSGKATPAPGRTHGSSSHAGNPPGQDHRPTSAATPRSHVPAGRG
ncbi:hypothetical protein [Cellulomonas alba]|uniref:Uncharacterized protein n=1 Tax=Cellulomonas alba TaxID=3053467 RepID=A0ABT7SGG9_9CELL|nr:hypothetical protein [Cellulomonas alba]MDM7855139.1 hypothetical protein [Cellulomonas alba]